MFSDLTLEDEKDLIKNRNLSFSLISYGRWMVKRRYESLKNYSKI